MTHFTKKNPPHRTQPRTPYGLIIWPLCTCHHHKTPPNLNSNIMTHFAKKENTFTITSRKSGTFQVACPDPNCTCLNFVGGSVYATASRIYKLLVSTLESMPENNSKSLTITIIANE